VIKTAACELRKTKRGSRGGSASPARILVLGLGNEILKDDAVGILIAKKLRGWFPCGVEIHSTSLFGLSLLDELIDRERVLLIDSFLPESPASAEIREITLDSLGNSQAACPHFVGLAEIREVMRLLDLGFPREIRILGIPVLDPLTFSTEISQEVVGRVDEAVERARRIVQTWLSASHAA
jgi:hydrogenase maturation protease